MTKQNKTERKERQQTTPLTYYPISIEAMLGRGQNHDCVKDKMLAIAIGRISKGVIEKPYELIKEICDTEFDPGQHDDDYFLRVYGNIETKYYKQKERKQRLTKVQIELAKEYNDLYNDGIANGFTDEQAKGIAQRHINRLMEKYNVEKIELDDGTVYTL